MTPGLDPTVVVGGKAASMGGSNARVGQSDFLVVESDESDGSFLKLSPILAVVTNIDREHLDHYPSIVEIRAAFLEFVQKVPFYGAAILCLDDENVQQLLPLVNRRIITYGRSQQAALQIADVDCGAFESRFSVRTRGHNLGTFHLRVPGVHNVLNATAAIAVGLELDIQLESIREALASYSGVDRRFQMRGQARGVTVIDDYGHHPTEIRATLAAAQLCKFRRVHVVFQPHRYTRTQHLMDEFARAFIRPTWSTCSISTPPRKRRSKASPARRWRIGFGNSGIAACITPGPSRRPWPRSWKKCATRTPS